MKNEEKKFVLTTTIESILSKKKTARDNDDILYADVCKQLNPAITTASFSDVMSKRKQYGIPTYESVRRTRAKLQAKKPELRGKFDGTTMRSKRVKEFLDYPKKTK